MIVTMSAIATQCEMPLATATIGTQCTTSVTCATYTPCASARKEGPKAVATHIGQATLSKESNKGATGKETQGGRQKQTIRFATLCKMCSRRLLFSCKCKCGMECHE